nr:copia protein [Tanacetum cinerariifolium]
APVARIEAIRLFLAYASIMGFTVYQMDVKSAFLYGTIDEEVYVMQAPGFQDLESSAEVYKVEKAMYGLHQAPRAWLSMPCEALSKEISSSILLLIVPLFDSMLVPQGEGSGTPTEPYHTPSLEAQQTSLTTYSSPSLPPSSALPPVVDEPVSPLRDVSQGEACPTVSSLEAEQDRANIAKTSTLPHESTSMVTSVASDEVQELEINSLKARIKLLEDKYRGVTDQSRDDAPIMGKRLDEGEEAAERVKVATATVSIPTGSIVVSTSSPTIPTAAAIFTTATESTPYTKRKRKEKMVEFDTPKKKKLQEQIDVQVVRELEEEMARDAQRMNEQIARDVEIARIHAEEELQMLIDGLDRNNETVTKYLQEYDQFAAEFPFERRIELISDLAKHFKGMTLEEIKEKFDLVWKQIQDFVPLGSKEEAKRFKRKGLRLEQESVKKLKTSKEVLKEVKSFEEVPKEKVKEMMQLVLIEEIYVEALQVKHLIIDWKHLDREDLNQLWRLVKESRSIRPASSDKEMELWVELKRLYEPDDEDQL